MESRAAKERVFFFSFSVRVKVASSQSIDPTNANPSTSGVERAYIHRRERPPVYSRGSTNHRSKPEQMSESKIP